MSDVNAVDEDVFANVEQEVDLAGAIVSAR